MDELEQRLRVRRDGLVGVGDGRAHLAAVRARGRRRAGIRLGIGGVLGLLLVGFAGGTVLSGPRPPAIDPVGAGDPSASTSTVEPVAPTPSRSDDPSAAPSSSAATATPSPASSPLDPPPDPDIVEPTTPSPPSPPRVELGLHVAMADLYPQGEPVTFTITACNATDREHEEFFFQEGHRFDLRVLTADDRAIAYTHGREYDGGYVTETWGPGECRSWTETWDQTEGWFDDPDDGPQAEPGEHTVSLDWRGVAPPPEGFDPGLYDPAGRRSPPPFGPFTIAAREQEPRGPLPLG